MFFTIDLSVSRDVRGYMGGRVCREVDDIMRNEQWAVFFFIM